MDSYKKRTIDKSFFIFIYQRAQLETVKNQ